MKEIPILFSTQMVKAIMEGRKTVTRRVINPQPELIESSGRWFWSKAKDRNGYPLVDASRYWWEYYKTSPYGSVGDLIWVRETTLIGPFGKPTYKASITDEQELFRKENIKRGNAWAKWIPSIHVPKSCARIWLEITSVNVERLLSITNYESVFEGIESWPDGNFKAYGKNTGKYTFARDSFFSLWESINGEGSTKNNPWVWVIEFKVLSTTGRP